MQLRQYSGGKVLAVDIVGHHMVTWLSVFVCHDSGNDHILLQDNRHERDLQRRAGGAELHQIRELPQMHQKGQWGDPTGGGMPEKMSEWERK